MVVDEELKMICDICHEGGQVLGPFLKPMSHLVHTEYLLAGRTHADVRDVLRDTMYAATVTGAPVENACRLIERYESEGRGYYGAALALLGRDEQGRHTADSPIVIRTADVAHGRAGSPSPPGPPWCATATRSARSPRRVAKASGILSAFGLVPGASSEATAGIAELASDEDVLIALNSRNQRLARFWLTDQSGAAPVPELTGRRVVILHGEDDFANMLLHVFAVLGMRPRIVRHRGLHPGRLRRRRPGRGGPGPGDPRDDDSPKIATFRAAVDQLLDAGTPFLAVCLGHQVLCHALGIPLAYKDIVFQGTQSEVGLVRPRPSRSASTTPSWRGPAGSRCPEGVRVEADPATGDVHLVAGPHYRGVQFHAESILTEDGVGILRQLLLDLLG